MEFAIQIREQSNSPFDDKSVDNTLYQQNGGLCLNEGKKFPFKGCIR